MFTIKNKTRNTLHFSLCAVLAMQSCAPSNERGQEENDPRILVIVETELTYEEAIRAYRLSPNPIGDIPVIRGSIWSVEDPLEKAKLDLMWAKMWFCVMAAENIHHSDKVFLDSLAMRREATLAMFSFDDSIPSSSDGVIHALSEYDREWEFYKSIRRADDR